MNSLTFGKHNWPLDALSPFFQDKVQSVFKLFDILYTANSYEIGHVFATSGFQEIEISNLSWALIKVEARNSNVSNYIGDFGSSIRPIAAKFSWSPQTAYVCNSTIIITYRNAPSSATCLQTRVYHWYQCRLWGKNSFRLAH